MSSSSSSESDSDTSVSDYIYEDEELNDVGLAGVTVNDDDDGIQPYQFEPYRAAEDVREHAEVDATWQDRLENTNWCSCDNCQTMNLAMECVCCQEIDKVKAKCDESDPASTCIVHHPDFTAVCLNKGVLDTAYLHYRQQYDVDDSTKREDEKYRHVAYRQLCRWCWHFLGENVRRVMPACAVIKIRETFPSPTGVYTGFLLR